MDNRDIFDEADLLAIANDDDDDDDDDGTANTDDASSSVQFPFNIPSKQTAPTNHEELDDEHANDDGEVDFGFGFGGSVPDARTDVKTTNRNPPSGGAENIDHDNEKDVPTDDSDEDDDDGFLASWMETEKQLALATSASASSPSKPLHTNEDASNDQPQYGNKHEKDKDIDHSFSTNGKIDQCGKRDDKHDKLKASRPCPPSRNENKNDVSPLSPSNSVFKTEISDDYAHHDSDNDDDDDDDDEDDENDVGFLESWSQRERHRTSPDERAPDDERPGDRDVKEVTIKEKITTPTTNSTFESTPSSRTKSTRDQTHQDEGDKCNVKMELGESILRWISNQKSAMANDPSAKRLGNREISNNTKNANTKKLSNYHEFGGVISIQQSKSKKNPPSSSSSLIRLSTLAAKHDTMGRSRTSKKAANVRQVILERFAPRGVPEPASETTQDAPTRIESTQSGQASFAPNPETTLPGTMVDCLAIYDSQRGCYVLEIVEMTVSKLRAVSNKAALAYSNRSVGSTATGSTNNDAERKETTMNTTIPDVTFPQPVWIDPRSRAKRAEDQIRRLKRGKGKLSGGGAKISKKRQKVNSTREKDGKHDNLNSTGNDEMKVKTFVVVDEKLNTSNVSKKEHLK